MGKKVQKTDDNPLLIPFGRAVRVGNFKLWRGNYNLGTGKDKNVIECVHVSNLDGSWMVRIPSTSTMFSLIVNGYATVDEAMREKFLGMVFTNQLNVCASGSESLHDAFFFLTEMMTFPYLLLSEKEMKDRMEKEMKELGFDKAKRKEHIGKMCEYRSQLYELIEQKKARLIENYERQQAEQRKYAKTHEEEDMKHDELAEQAMEVLKEESNEEAATTVD